MIKSAVLLAAGRGTRLRPYTDEVPKPLLPVKGRPTLDFVLHAVAKAGIERVCLVTHHLEEKIFKFVGDGSKWNLNVTFAHQDQLCGNGNAMLSVPVNWIRSESIMVIATDYILEENALLDLVEMHKRHHAEIMISLKECPPEELTSRSTVEIDSNWQVKHIIEKPKLEQIQSPYAASILFILPSEIWEYLAKVPLSSRGEFEMQTAIDRMIQDGFKAFGLLQPMPLEWTSEFINNTETS